MKQRMQGLKIEKSGVENFLWKKETTSQKTGMLAGGGTEGRDEGIEGRDEANGKKHWRKT